MAAETAPLWTIWLGSGLTFVGGLLLAAGGAVFHSIYARIDGLSVQLNTVAAKQASDVEALRRERQEGDREVWQALDSMRTEVSEMRAEVAKRDDVRDLHKEIGALRDLIVRQGGTAFPTGK